MSLSKQTSSLKYQSINPDSSLFKEEVKTKDVFQDVQFQYTDEEEQEVVSIIDKRLMIFILIMTFVLNMDRTNISNAISDNLAADLGFTNDSVNTGILVYHLVFTICTIPSNAIAKAVGPNRWIPILMSSWAVVTWAHALIHNFEGFITVRTLIAVTEAGFIPACLTYMNLWYKTNELGTRLAWFWASQALASATSGLISFGVFRMRGIYGLEGWKWLFIIDGIVTHLVGIAAFFCLPSSPSRTAGRIWKDGWFTKKQTKIAELRIIRDDKTKKENHKPVTKQDVIQAITDLNLWTHLAITFLGQMPGTPIGSYLPSMIKNAGFETTTANLLTAPSHIFCMFMSIWLAQSADKRGNIAFHALLGSLWGLCGAILLENLPDNVGRWQLYAAALFTASTPSWHGMHIAWMSSNMAPMGKRILALGAIIGAANINGVPGSQIYQASDAPRFRRGNKIIISLHVTTIVLFLMQRYKYTIVNKWRRRIWNNMTDYEKEVYDQENEEQGNKRIDFYFRL